MEFETKMQLLNAAHQHYDAIASRARANMAVYLNSSTGIGEHSDLVEEIVEFIDKITAAEDCKRTIESVIKDVCTED